MGYALSRPLADLMDEFLAYEKPRTTTQGYETLAGTIRRVLRWFDDEDLDVLTVGITDAVRYAAWLAERRNDEGKEYSTGTMRKYLMTARKFFGFLLQTERIKTNPFQEVRYPRLPEYLPRNVLTEAQMGRLLAELARFDTPATVYARQRRYRVHVLAEFLYATGLRITEACSLFERDLDLVHRLVYLPCGKGEKPRMVFLTGYAAQVLERYVARGRAVVMQAHNNASLFGADKPAMARQVNIVLTELCTALELPVITCHGFRHSLGTHLLRAGCDMRHIQVILGHESLGTTQIYTRVDKDDLKRSLDMYHPRQWRNAREGAGHDE